jgi:hypothetical protein
MQAVATAIVLLGLVAVAYALGRRAVFVLICAAVLVALFELLDALWSIGRRPVVPFGLLCSLAVLVTAYAGRPGLLSARWDSRYGLTAERHPRAMLRGPSWGSRGSREEEPRRSTSCASSPADSRC